MLNRLQLGISLKLNDCHKLENYNVAVQFCVFKTLLCTFKYVQQFSFTFWMTFFHLRKAT